MNTQTRLLQVQSVAYQPVYDSQPTHLTAHWLKDKEDKLYCCWVRESVKS